MEDCSHSLLVFQVPCLPLERPGQVPLLAFRENSRGPRPGHEQEAMSPTKKVKNAFKFVRVWQKAETVGEVARKMGISKRSCSMRAGMYRNKHGVPLKRFGEKVAEIPWAELAALAVRLG